MSAEHGPIRILVGKPGLDGHDRGAKYVAHVLRDAGFEVIYTGIRKSPEQIVQTAIQEDVSAIGLSILSGAHLELMRRLFELLKAKQADDIPVFLGGTIPTDDHDELKRLGVVAIFPPGTSAQDIIRTVRDTVERAA